MNLSKSYEFFQPEKCKERIHIIGCGSVGSSIAVLLARAGITKMTFWDFDTVEEHNIVNQMFTRRDIGMSKVEALKRQVLEINPDIEEDLKLKPSGWDGEMLSGYIFLCVDSIELRKRIVEQHMDNTFVKAVFDFRTLLTGAQHYAADWGSVSMKEALLNSMQFTHEEAASETPVSACGVTLGVAPTVWAICSLGVSNFINFTKGEGIKKMMSLDCFIPDLIAF